MTSCLRVHFAVSPQLHEGPTIFLNLEIIEHKTICGAKNVCLVGDWDVHVVVLVAALEQVRS